MFKDPELEESWQAEEYDKFFLSDDEEEEELSAYALVDDLDVIGQLQITNDLLGQVNSLLFVFMIFGLMRFIMRLLSDNIFNHL